VSRLQKQVRLIYLVCGHARVPHDTSRHLIADHLGWFKDGTDEGKFKTIEDMMKQKGEAVKRGRLADGEVLEFAPDS
jgi:protein import protein ZIM17